MEKMTQIEVHPIVTTHIGWKNEDKSTPVDFVFEGLSAAQAESLMIYRGSIMVRDQVRALIKDGARFEDALTRVVGADKVFRLADHVGMRKVAAVRTVVFDLQDWVSAGCPGELRHLAVQYLKRTVEVLPSASEEAFRPILVQAGIKWEEIAEGAEEGAEE